MWRLWVDVRKPDNFAGKWELDPTLLRNSWEFGHPSIEVEDEYYELQHAMGVVRDVTNSDPTKWPETGGVREEE